MNTLFNCKPCNSLDSKKLITNAAVKFDFIKQQKT